MKRATHLSVMTPVEAHRQTIEPALTREEWERLPRTSPAKAVRPRHARKVILAITAAIPTATALATIAAGEGVARAIVGSVISIALALELARLADARMRWSGYRSLFNPGHHGPGLP